LSQEDERVYTINLGKVLLSPDNQRAKRAINMIKEFARHHMKTEEVKLEEDVSHLVWSRGIRRPPRKIRVRMTKTDEGYVLISKYEGEEVSTEKDEKKTKPEKIKSKAHKKAKEVFANKLIGDKSWSDLSDQEKIQIEKKLAKKKGAIEKLAKKLAKQVKKDELAKVKKNRAS
jgi:large subunit ribosomal protein L31e